MRQWRPYSHFPALSDVTESYVRVIYFELVKVVIRAPSTMSFATGCYAATPRIPRCF